MGSGRVIPLAARAGRVLSLEGHELPRAASEPAQVHERIWILMLTLPMFAQVFHYMIDVGPIYLLSKAWAVLMLPFAIYGLVGLRSRFALLYLLTLIYVLGVTPVLSMAWFGNDPGDALANSVKIWSLSYYFSLLGLLVWLAPSPQAIVKSIFRLGIATIVIMWVLWYSAPYQYYLDGLNTKLFLTDDQRGNRIYFPMTFAFLVLFYALARLLERPRLWQPVLILAVLLTEHHLFKERMAEAACLLVMAGMVIYRLPPIWRTVALMSGLASVAAGLVVLFVHAEKIIASLGGSLSVRQNSIMLVQNYLAQQPLRWIFGTGAASRVGGITMADIVGRRDFYLADLGWAGIVFEFGTVGTLLLMALYGLVLRWSWRVPVAPDPSNRAMIAALIGYVAYLALCTAIYSPVYAPGELASITALLLYLNSISKANAGSGPIKRLY